jgi:hypothetical protein
MTPLRKTRDLSLGFEFLQVSEGNGKIKEQKGQPFRGKLMRDFKKAFPLVLLTAFLLAGCSFFSSADDATAGYVSFSGTQVSDSVGQIIETSAQENIIDASNVAITYSYSHDDTAIYKDGLAEASTNQTATSTGNLTLYSNHMIEEEFATVSDVTFFTGSTISSYSKSEATLWMGDPVDSTLTDVYSLFSENKTTDKDGNVLYDSFAVNRPSFTTIANAENAWGQYLADLLDGVYSTSTSLDFYQTGDDAYIGEADESSTGTLSNPLYPNDATKTLSTFTFSQTVYSFTQISEGAFHLTGMSQVSKVFVSSDFTQTLLESPAAIASTSIEYVLTYDDITTGTRPTYQDGSDAVSSPMLTLFSVSGTDATFQTNSYLNDVSASYRLLHPSFEGSAFSLTTSLSSNMAYAFSDEASVGAATPVYNKWGFADIASASIRYDTITDWELTGGDYFAAVSGRYSIQMLFDSSNALTSISVTYLGD